MEKSSRIYIAGHRGLVGSAMVRRLQLGGFTNLITRTRTELDLGAAADVERFFEQEKPEYVILAAAKVGGILANNTYPADFIRHNLLIQNNVIEACYRSGVRRLLFLGSSCIYPSHCPQPIREEYLLTGPLEPTNRPYAIAKIAGIETCWAYNRQYGTQFLAAMPTNLYGPEDNFNLQTSHVLPALIRKALEARLTGKRELVVWGSGRPRRELLYSDDLADACIFLLQLAEERYQGLLRADYAPIVNIGIGEDQTIRELAETVCRVTGFDGGLAFDTNRPDGTPQKLLDVSRIHALGWHATTGLEQGIRQTLAAVEKRLTAEIWSDQEKADATVTN